MKSNKVFVILMLGSFLLACQKNDNQEVAQTGTAPADASSELSGTLAKIKQSGTIVLGYRDSSIPFSYVANDPNQPIGYSHDLSVKVAEAVKQKLNLPNLNIRYNLVTSQTRIPLVSNGTVDLECGSTTNNEERAKQVDFSVGFFQIGTRLLVPKGSPIKDFTDLQGKTLVTTAGTTSERYIRKYNDDNHLDMRIISAKDHGEAFLMLRNGRADAFMMDDILLAGEKAKSQDPDDFEIVGTPQSYEIYGCMLRKGDKPFKDLVDNTLKATYASGEINTIYNQWFNNPIPPKNVNLNFPESEGYKKLIEEPHDRPE